MAKRKKSRKGKKGGHVPLKVLEKRYKHLGHIIKSRGGNV